MRRLSLLLLPLLVVAIACSNPAEPVQSSAPSAPSFSMLPGSTVTPSGATCAQVFNLAYGPYNGANNYWSDYYRTFCTTPDGTVTPLPTPTPPPTYPAPTPKPTCSYSRTGCTKTAGNN